jgi:hypothetical protein
VFYGHSLSTCDAIQLALPPTQTSSSSGSLARASGVTDHTREPARDSTCQIMHSTVRCYATRLPEVTHLALRQPRWDRFQGNGDNALCRCTQRSLRWPES